MADRYVVRESQPLSVYIWDTVEKRPLDMRYGSRIAAEHDARIFNAEGQG